MFILNPRVSGVSAELLALYKKVCPSTIGHMTDFGFIKNLQPLFRPLHFVGNAVTVQLPHMDSTAVHKVLDIVEAGDVVCIAMSGDTKRACWGELVSYMAKTKNIAGAVIDGCITDYKALNEIGIPIYSRGISPLTTRILGIEGSINVPVSINNVTIHPGDLVVADDDGVFVTNPKDAFWYGQRALAVQQSEIDVKQKIDAGIALSEILGAGKHFKQGEL